MTGYLDGVMWPVVLILPKMTVYVKTFKDVFRIDDRKLLEKYKTI